jgi:U3 small nucleolar RNA-associated protein 22
MAPHATKRRKVSHSPDDSEVDVAIDSPSSPSISEVGDETKVFDQISDDGSSGNDDESGAGMRKSEESSVLLNSSGHSQQQVRPNQPTNRDSSGVAFTGEVFKSNLFQLQVDELLEQIRPKKSKQDILVERELRSLKAVIEAIPARAPVSVRTSSSLTARND